MTGICAGDKQQVQLGDLVVAERVFTYDTGGFVLVDGRQVHEPDIKTYNLNSSILTFLHVFEAWKPLVAELQRPHLPKALSLKPIACYLKSMASGHAVRRNNPFSEVQRPVRSAIAIDMEGAALGLVMSKHPTVPWLIVKSVSDYASPKKNDKYRAFAMQASSRYALSFIREYVTNERLPPIKREEERTTQKPSNSIDSTKTAHSQNPNRHPDDINYPVLRTDFDHLIMTHTQLFAGREEILRIASREIRPVSMIFIPQIDQTPFHLQEDYAVSHAILQHSHDARLSCL